jgi:N-acyl-D-aspartate/D-glutamate deacylase
MQHVVDEALEQGALGMSVGLTLVPSSFADTDELKAPAEPLGITWSTSSGPRGNTERACGL